MLFITAETYSKYIDPTDRSLRTIFGDGAAATLVEASDRPSLSSFVFGTDGRGADTLLVTDGGARKPEDAIQPRKRRRWPSSLYMDGPELVKFSLEAVPPVVDKVLASANWTRDQVDMYLFHQATLFMLDHLRERLSLDLEHTPEALAEYGNTVSSTIPILINDLRRTERLRPGKQTLLIGFGVGLSWAGCAWTETWSAEQSQIGEKRKAQACKSATPGDSKSAAAESAADPQPTDPNDCREAA